MSNCILSKKQYRIIKMSNSSFIIINTNLDFKNGHTHINNYTIAKAIIFYCLNGYFSKSFKHLENNDYIMESIRRISECKKAKR